MIVDMSVSDLIPCLPHRPPMVWINKVSSVGKDYKWLAGTCEVNLDKEALYISNKKELRGSAAIEFTAQAFGYLKAAYQKIHKFNDPPSKTYLTGVRSCQTNFSQLDLEASPDLEVRVSVLRELLPITYVRGEVFIKGTETKLAETEIQVYVD